VLERRDLGHGDHGALARGIGDVAGGADGTVLDDRGHPDDAGLVHEHVEPPEARLGGLRCRADRARSACPAGRHPSLGTFSTAQHLLLPGLVEEFVGRHPQVKVRIVGENSALLADAVRAGRLEAALVALPIDDDGLEVGGAVAEFEVEVEVARSVRSPRP
jgi:DNA-binding transcriptional LysR family regulator